MSGIVARHTTAVKRRVRRQVHHVGCDALRENRVRLVAESWGPDSRGRLLLEDGSVQDIESGGA
jgi:hypothetical protein